MPFLSYFFLESRARVERFTGTSGVRDYRYHRGESTLAVSEIGGSLDV
jgi:hypothetical protein